MKTKNVIMKDFLFYFRNNFLILRNEKKIFKIDINKIKKVEIEINYNIEEDIFLIIKEGDEIMNINMKFNFLIIEDNYKIFFKRSYIEKIIMDIINILIINSLNKDKYSI